MWHWKMTWVTMSQQENDLKSYFLDYSILSCHPAKFYWIPAISILSFDSRQCSFSICCMILAIIRVLMDSSFIKKSTLTFVHQGNVYSFKMWIRQSISYPEDWWVYTSRKRTCLRRILGRIKRTLITRPECWCKPYYFLCVWPWASSLTSLNPKSSK